MRRLFSLCVVLAVVAGCAHKDMGNNSAKSGDTGEGSEIKDISSFRLSDPEGPKVVDQELDVIPTEVNPLVEKWITYFQGRGREHMERYLGRSSRYEKLMKKVLRDNGLPEDLFYIALIESGFSSQATSHAAAVGYWQFIRGTGKRYGLDINPFVDERRDPVFATQAAAEYFKGLYSVFGSWYLAMASYNVGENRVKREVMNHYTRDFWELARKNRLPKETINYVPKFIAAKLIAKDPAKYGFEDIDYLPPIEFDHITVKQPVNMRQMADKLNLNYEDFKALNPKFKGEVAILKGNELILRIPPGTNEAALVAANESAVTDVRFIADSGDTQTYKIRRGDNLKTIGIRSAYLSVYREPIDLEHPYVYVNSTYEFKEFQSLLYQTIKAKPELLKETVQIGMKEQWPFPWVMRMFESPRYDWCSKVAVPDAWLYLCDPGNEAAVEKVLKGPYMKINIKFRQARETSLVYVRKNLFDQIYHGQYEVVGSEEEKK